MSANWPLIKAKYLLTLQNHVANEEDGTVTAFRDGEVVLRSERRTDGFTEAEKYIGYQGVKPGELVIHSMDAFAGAIGISKSKGKMSPVVHIYSAGHHVDLRYYSYYLRHLAKIGYIQSLSKGIRERSTAFDPSMLSQLDLLKPSFEEQKKISDFLDEQTRIIDTTVELKKAMRNASFEAYNSYRHNLVTGSEVSPKVKTNLDWIPDAPVSWTKLPLRSLFSWHKGKDPARLDNNYCESNPGQFPVYSGQTGDGGVFGLINTFDFSFSEKCTLVSTVGAQAGTMRIVSGKFSLSQNCALLIPKSSNANAAYLYYLWPSIWSSMKSKIPSDMQPSLRLSDLSDTWLFLPPVNEQISITNLLRTQEDELLTMVGALDQSITKLEELKASLITSAVTGMHDVETGRNFA
jgi:type I restriction enzyme S subunit